VPPAEARTTGRVSETPPLLQVTAGGKTFPGLEPVQALTDLDLSIWEGEFVAITGKSGSGKSTLLNVLGLLDNLSSGDYRIAGESTLTMPSSHLNPLRAKMFGFVFQAFHLVPYLTAAENVELGMTYRPTVGRERRRRVDRLLVDLQIDHRRDSRVTTLSGGERQRVAIARSLVGSPRVLLADEPTGNLDEGTSISILDIFEEINRSGVTIVVVTHDRATASRARREVRIRDGAVSFDARSGL
jgi:putative ABC transport system ATP-binding protein